MKRCYLVGTSSQSSRPGAAAPASGRSRRSIRPRRTLLAHPYLQAAIGSSRIEGRDPFGMENIQALRDTARDGGGVIVFVWPNPDHENREELKIGLCFVLGGRHPGVLPGTAHPTGAVGLRRGVLG